MSRKVKNCWNFVLYHYSYNEFIDKDLCKLFTYFLGAGGGGPIKIQAIQTNPNTGAKQIVAIPIHSSGQNTQTITVNSPATTTMGNSRMVSPMKVIKIPGNLKQI